MHSKDKRSYLTGIIPVLFILLVFTSCTNHSLKTSEEVKNPGMKKQSNPVIYFEIPVTNLDRAVTFYKTVFSFGFEKDTIDNNEMGLFPFSEEKTGISGALAKGEIYKPTKDGVLIYFKTEKIHETLKLAEKNGGKLLYPVTDNGAGLVAEFEDTEGNRIALFQQEK